jgi:hypothetical protein
MMMVKPWKEEGEKGNSRQSTASGKEDPPSSAMRVMKGAARRETEEDVVCVLLRAGRLYSSSRLYDKKEKADVLPSR